MFPLDDPMSLSLLYHLNSEPWLNDDAYRSPPAPQEWQPAENSLGRVTLPPPAESALAALFRARRSCRRFDAQPMPLDRVSALVAAAYGVTEIAAAGFLRRSVPSAGGLFPLEVHVIAQRVTGLNAGLYRYDAFAHAFDRVADLPFARLEPAFYTYAFMRDASLVITLSAVFRRTQKKYGPRGYRYILLEAGHAVQNVCLRAAELGLSTLCMGGFIDSAANRLLGFDPSKEGMVYSVAVGYDAADVGPPRDGE